MSKGNLNKAVFDKCYHTLSEISNLSNEEIIEKVKSEEDAQVSAIYSIEDFNYYNSMGAFDNSYILDVYL